MSAVPKEQASLAAAGRRRGFLSRHEEGDLPSLTVRGTLPPWLRGRLLLNGPALWELPQGRFRHWFDGLAQLHAIQIPGHGGPVSYRSRFLRSEAYQRSIATGKPVLGGYGTGDGRGLLSRLLSIADPPRTDNAAVVMSRIGKRWLATTESDRAHWFDPYTLDSQGELHWQDEQKLPLMAAHPAVDAQGRWWNVGISLACAAGTRRRCWPFMRRRPSTPARTSCSTCAPRSPA